MRAGVLVLAFVLASTHCTPFDSVDSAAPPSPDADAGADGDGGSTCASEVDLQNDPRNCGTCGRDCAGGTCAEGVCRPYVIVENAGTPYYISVNRTHAYWTSFTLLTPPGDGTLRSAPKLGGSSEELEKNEDSFDVLATDDDVYFTSVSDTNGGGLWRRPVAGGSAVPLWTTGEVIEVTRAANTLYFTVRAPTSEGVWSKRGDDAPVKLVPLTTTDILEGIYVDDNFVYWATRWTAIGRVARDGTGRSDTWVQSPNIRRLTGDDEAVYYTAFADGAPPGSASPPASGVFRVDKTTRAVTQLYSAAIEVGSIVVAGDWLYATITGDGNVVRFDKRTGDRLVVLAERLDQPMGIAQDAEAIYFTERGAGRIHRAVK